MSALDFDVICQETLLGLQIYHIYFLIGPLCSVQSGHYTCIVMILLRVGWGGGRGNETRIRQSRLCFSLNRENNILHLFVVIADISLKYCHRNTSGAKNREKGPTNSGGSITVHPFSCGDGGRETFGMMPGFHTAN